MIILMEWSAKKRPEQTILPCNKVQAVLTRVIMNLWNQEWFLTMAVVLFKLYAMVERAKPIEFVWVGNSIGDQTALVKQQ